jgi:gamma-glutamyltranspeptidase/glutathione hydrolase
MKIRSNICALVLACTLLYSCKLPNTETETSQSSAKVENNDSWVGEKFSGFHNRKTVTADDYMISTADGLASKAGANILAQGGNAIDAAIAAQMVLNVVEPQSSGIGGGLFLLYYDAKSGKTVYFNGRETAPAKAHDKMFLDKNGEARAFHDVVGGGLSVATPGALKALEKAHKKYGKIAWKKLFQPAIQIANDGFVLDEKIHVILNQLPYLTKFDGMKIYFENGNPKAIGSIIKNPALAKTFTTIAAKGSKAFYRGKIAKNMVAAVQNSAINPGYLSLTDLKKYRSKKGSLLCGKYRKKYKICSMPLPSSGGIALLQILKTLENFDLSKMKPSSLEAVHLISEATRLAYADRNEYVADSKAVPTRKMLSKKYLKERAKLIKMDSAMSEVSPGSFTKKSTRKKRAKINEKPSTTHLAIVDKKGNAVSMTSTIEYLFGSVLMVDGFMLNNQLTDFSLSPTLNGKLVANRVQPKKQPRSSMTPTFVFDDKNNLIMVIGSPGGPRIIQYVAKTIIAALDWNMDIQSAISLPNHVVLNDQIELENRTSLTGLKSGLEKLGHKVKLTDITSGLNGITINDSGLSGGADPRRNGLAIGK